jgi:hypothetical protein
MANTLNPKLDALRQSDHDPAQGATHVCRLLGVITHNPEAIRAILTNDERIDGGPVLEIQASGSTEGLGQSTSFRVAAEAANKGEGSGLVLDVAFDSEFDLDYAVIVAEPGSDYCEGEEITFPGTLFGGLSPLNDLTVTIAQVERFGDELNSAKVLLLAKLQSVLEALFRVDPGWEYQYELLAKRDLVYYDVPDEVKKIAASILEKDFGGGR